MNQKILKFGTKNNKLKARILMEVLSKIRFVKLFFFKLIMMKMRLEVRNTIQQVALAEYKPDPQNVQLDSLSKRGKYITIDCLFLV